MASGTVSHFSRRSLLGLTAAGVTTAASSGLATPAAAVDRRRRKRPGTGTTLTLVGTSGGPIWWPGSDRRGVCSAVTVGDALYLVDQGDAAGDGLRATGLLGPAAGQNDLHHLRGVFLSHLHSDHVSDLSTLLLQGWVGGGLGTPERPVELFGPGRRGALPETFPAARPDPAPAHPENPGAGTEDMVASLVAAFATDINDRMFDSASPDIRSRVVAHDIELPRGAGARPNERPPRIDPFLVTEDDRVRVTATLVDHGQMFPSFGFRFDTDDGSVVFSGDTTVSENLVELARDCDVLVHEVIDEDWVAESISSLPVPPEVKDAYFNHMIGAHTTIEQVGGVAQRAGARKLVLNHFVPGEPERSRWRRAGRGYDGRLVIGEDGMDIDVSRRRRR